MLGDVGVPVWSSWSTSKPDGRGDRLLRHHLILPAVTDNSPADWPRTWTGAAVTEDAAARRDALPEGQQHPKNPASLAVEHLALPADHSYTVTVLQDVDYRDPVVSVLVARPDGQERIVEIRDGGDPSTLSASIWTAADELVDCLAESPVTAPASRAPEIVQARPLRSDEASPLHRRAVPALRSGMSVAASILRSAHSPSAVP